MNARDGKRKRGGAKKDRGLYRQIFRLDACALGLVLGFLFLSSCGGAQIGGYNGLPLLVTMTPEMQEATLGAIDGLNNVLGPSFEIGEGDITVTCDIEHKYTTDKRIGIYYQRQVFLDCDREISAEKKALIVAHELFHALGFIEHYDNPECLNSSSSPDRGRVEDAVCSEMIEDFDSVYGTGE